MLMVLTHANPVNPYLRHMLRAGAGGAGGGRAGPGGGNACADQRGRRVRVFGPGHRGRAAPVRSPQAWTATKRLRHARRQYPVRLL